MNPDNHEIFDRAHEAMNLEQMMSALGHGEFIGKGKVCPFCSDRKKRWGTVKTPQGLLIGKCFAPGCPTGGAALTQIGYLSLHLNESRTKAARRFLEMAVPELIAAQDEARKKRRGVSEEPAQTEQPEREPLPGLPPFSAEHGPWNALFTTLAPLLNGDDVKALGKKRGLDPETIRLAGICPNRDELEAYVHSMGEHFSNADLLECGIMRRKDDREYFSGKLKGWGATGRKVKNVASGKKEMEYAAGMNPPLIPYFDGRGVCTYMRPHKDYIIGLRDEIEAIESEFFNLDGDDGDESLEVPPCGAHPYLPPRFLENLRAWDGVCIITEGEFKALAADQCGIACMAVPGITFIRNPAFRAELLQLLEQLRVQHVVIIFDNEVKDDPAFPEKYQPDPKKQFDTQFYAEYTMRNLRQALYGRGGTARVGWLPDKFRKNGKADFDGILAHFTNANGFELGTDKARAVFERCIAKATDSPEKMKQSPGEDDLFPSRGRRIIENRMIRMEMAVQLAFGGYREKQLAMQLMKRDLTIDDSKQRHAVDKPLAEALVAVVGCYYTRKKVEKDSTAELRTRKAELDGLISSERGKDKEKRDMELLRSMYSALAAVNERLLGMPEPCSNFVMRCEYMLHTSDGTQKFLVRVRRTFDGEWSGLIPITPNDAANPRDMKVWAMGLGACNYTGAIHELDKLRGDMLVQCYKREIHSLATVGHDTRSNLWVWSDVAFADDKANPEGRSEMILPDDNGHFWNRQGVGYFAENANSDGDRAFTLGIPSLLSTPHHADNSVLFEEGELGDRLMHYLHDLRDSRAALKTGVALDANAEILAVTEDIYALGGEMRTGAERPDLDVFIAKASGTIRMVQGTATKEVALRDLLDKKLAALVFEYMLIDYHHAIGEMDAWLMLGGILGSAARPELLYAHNCQPGVMVFGPVGSGKSERLKMAMCIWGWDESKVDLTKGNATQVGLTRMLKQYGISPFIDEFRRTNHDADQFQGLMRSAADGSSGAKGNIKGSTTTTSIKSNTTPMVAGETMFDDPAARTRFIAVQVQNGKRGPESEPAFQRIKQRRHWYHYVGKYILTWRRKFATGLIANLAEWSKETRHLNFHDRVSVATGTGYCAVKTVCDMLGIAPRGEDFKDYAKMHAAQNSTDISEQTFRNSFWEDVTNMIINRESSVRVPQYLFDRGTKEINGISIPVLYIAAGPIYSIWEQYCRSRGREATMTLNNLRDEISKEPYWIPSQPDKHRFKTSDDKDASTKQIRHWTINALNAPFATHLYDALGWSE